MARLLVDTLSAGGFCRVKSVHKRSKGPSHVLSVQQGLLAIPAHVLALLGALLARLPHESTEKSPLTMGWKHAQQRNTNDKHPTPIWEVYDTL